MPSGRFLSLSQIIAGHRAAKFQEEFSTEWAAALLWRPPALILAWALQRTPVTPTLVTVTAVLSLPLMAIMAAFLSPGPALAWTVLLAIAFMILDCADGTLARITGRTSSLGQYIDFAADVCFRLAFYGSAGWAMTQHSGLAGSWLQSAGFGVAVISAWMMSFARLCRVYSELRFPTSPPRAEPGQPTVLSTVAGFLSGFDGLAPLIAAALWSLGLPQVFFIYIFIYALLDLGYTQFSIIGRLAKQT